MALLFQLSFSQFNLVRRNATYLLTTPTPHRSLPRSRYGKGKALIIRLTLNLKFLWVKSIFKLWILSVKHKFSLKVQSSLCHRKPEIKSKSRQCGRDFDWNITLRITGDASVRLRHVNVILCHATPGLQTGIGCKKVPSFGGKRRVEQKRGFFGQCDVLLSLLRKFLRKMSE